MYSASTAYKFHIGSDTSLALLLDTMLHLRDIQLDITNEGIISLI